MKRLVTIKLVNWHLFADRTVYLTGDTVLTGDNAAGKSTLLDAVQYVLTGGGTQFNKAANDNTKRDLVGYMRGKLGAEGKEYLRADAVTTHIALVFQDDQSICQTLGVVLDLGEDNSFNRRFYHVVNRGIDESFFKDQDQYRNTKDFFIYLKSRGIKHKYVQAPKDFKAILRQVLGVSSKYFELIPKALAFRPINELNKFIFDFLLKENRVPIVDLQENIRRYREIQSIIDEQRAELDILKQLKIKADGREEACERIRVLSTAEGLLKIEELEHEEERMKRSLDALKRDLERNAHQVDQAKKRYDDLEDQLGRVTQSLRENDAYLHLEGLKKRKEELDRGIEVNTRKIRQLTKSLVDAQRIATAVLGENPFSALIVGDAMTEQELNEQLAQAEMDFERIDDENDKLLYGAGEKKKAKEKEQNLQQKTLKNLKENRFDYPHNVNLLLDAVKKALYQKAGRSVPVNPLCELLDMKDQQWRDAAEGYLNTQKFDLIVPPQYFNEAVRVYERIKEKEHIYGVGIVDVQKLSIYDETRVGTLASKVSARSDYARRTVNMLLGRVDCVDNVDELRDHHIAITRTCMVYQNYTVRAINPNNYKKPFIGRDAIAIQIEQTQNTLNGLRDELIEIRKQIGTCDRIKKQIKAVNWGSLREHTHEFEDQRALAAKLTEVKGMLSDLEHNAPLLALMNQQDSIKEEKAKAGECKSELDRETGQLNERFSRENERLESTQQSLAALSRAQQEAGETVLAALPDGEKLLNEYMEKYPGDYTKIRDLFRRYKDEKEKEERDLQRQIESVMRDYNALSHLGLAEDVAAMDDYIQRLTKIRDYDLLSYEDDAIQARGKCENTFKEEFIAKLHERITSAQEDLDKLNRSLKDKVFNGDTYQFTYEASRNKSFAPYYKIIMSGEDYYLNTLFSQTISDANQAVMQELFDKLAIRGDAPANEKELQEYTDYRNYMHYDIKITHANGDVTYFSKVNREKSGGETQTPFYVIIAASFEQLVRRQSEEPACLVLFDEAFNNMDEGRIDAMMQFYRSLNIQVIIAVPPLRVQTILPFMDTALALKNYDNVGFVKAFDREEYHDRLL